jgi:hypothetical protein
LVAARGCYAGRAQITTKENNMTTYKTIRLSCLLAGSLLFTTYAFAQDGKVEVAGFGGGIYLSGGAGTHALVGGSGAVRIVDHLRMFGEFSYSELGSASASDEGVSATVKNKLYSIGGGADYSFGSSKRVVPYVLAAGGVGHQTVGLSASVGGTTASANVATSNSAYVGVGGGVRIYAGDNWGFKPEVRFQRYSGADGGSSGVFTVGIFYQFVK